MTKQLIPFQFETFQLRVEVDDDGEPVFHAGDLCAMLGYANPRDAVARHVEEEDVVKRDTLTEGGTQLATWVREPGMWSLILGSHAPNAKPVKRWVTAEVLPSIRKHGVYLTEEAKAKLAKELTESRYHLNRLYEENQNLRRSLNVKNERIIQLLEERVRPKPRPATTEEIQKIVRLNDGTRSLADIAALKNRTVASIRGILRKYRGT
jgi:prophage antirepressor-like protein